MSSGYVVVGRSAGPSPKEGDPGRGRGTSSPAYAGSENNAGDEGRANRPAERASDDVMGDESEARTGERRNDVSEEPGRRFVPNEELGEQGAGGLVAAPADFNAVCHLHRRGEECFACRYTHNKSTMDEAVGCWNKDDLSDAFTEMRRLIAENYGRGISNEELVNMVYEFYETEIRRVSPDDMFGEWSKNSIYQHIVYHTNDEGVQLQECESILYSQIQSLRQKTWIETEDGLQPHHRNISLLDKLVKSFTDTVSKRKTRK